MDNNEKTKEQLISELQEAQQQLVELNLVFEVLPDHIYKADMQGNIQFVTRGFPGLQQEPEVGMNIFDLLPPQLHEESKQHLEKLRAGEEVYLETEIPRPDGPSIWMGSRNFPVIHDNEVISTMSVISDITAQKQAEVERARLQQEVIDAQQRAIQELSTPVIPIMDRIIVMPLVGTIDSLRARDITRNLLAGISQHRAKVVILDVTGVGIVDTGVANHLNKTIQAAQLKGARTIVTGISDAVAEAIVDLGIDWSNITTLSDLQTGLVTALGSMGIKLSQ